MTPGVGVAAGLQALLGGAVKRLDEGKPTKDPAGVSPDVKPLLPENTVLPRLKRAADAINEAIDNDSDESAVRSAMSRMFWKYVESEEANALAGAASLLKGKAPVAAAALGLTGIAATVPPTRSFGNGCL
jgi:hypothetical protein